MTDLEIPDTGAVFTFGKSRFAENKPSHFFIKNDPVIHISCGDEHTTVICKNGRIFAFGSNEWGQLGLGHNNMVHKPSCVKALKPEKAKIIASGRAHTIILTESNYIYACGSNTDGQLGLENVDMVNIPTKIQCNQLKENGPIKKVSAGSQHSAALTESGLVFLWGSNSEGQLGLESNKTNNKFPTLLEFKEKITDISCGYYHTAVLTEKGELYTFGENEHGKLGLSHTENPIYKPTKVPLKINLTSIVCGGNQNFGLTENGDAIAFGSNTHGELGFDKSISSVSEPKLLPPELFQNEKLFMISCGENHTAFVTETFKIYTCGDTRHGKLCLEDQSEDGQFGPQLITRFNNYKITNVSCGGCHTIICAQKIQEDNFKPEINTLPPLQRIPNSILNPEERANGILTKPIEKETPEKNNDILEQENEISPTKKLDEPNENMKITEIIPDHTETENRLDHLDKNENNLLTNTPAKQIENHTDETKTLKKEIESNDFIDSVENLCEEFEKKSDVKKSPEHQENITPEKESAADNGEKKNVESINDDEDIKSSTESFQPDKKLSKLFVFKKKRNSEVTIEERPDHNITTDDTKKEEIQSNKTKIKTCSIL